MILLTDGRSNPDPPELAVQAATASKADGIIMFSVGLGSELDFAALERIASKPGYFFRAPRAEDLRTIYEEIAKEIPCPSGPASTPLTAGG
jgi:hypothetical protein